MSEIEDLEDEGTLDARVQQHVYPAKVKITRDQFSLFQLKRKANPERQEIIIDPDFQRLFVWDLKDKSELIESILMGIPLPVLYFFEQNDGKLQVVDGRQRLTAIFQYMDNEFALSELKILPDEKGKKFSDLSPMMQGIIEDFQMTVYKIQPPTPEDVKFDIFDRVNRGGKKLNHQEMRNALHQGKSTRLLRKLSETDEFLLATGRSIKPGRMKDRYIILRFLSFFMYFNKWDEFLDVEYKSDIDDFLAKAMDVINDFSDEKITKLEEVFVWAMQNSFEILGEDAFRFSKGGEEKKLPINMALFEVLTFFFSDTSVDYRSKANEIKVALNFKKMELYNSDFSKQVDSSTRVNERFGAIMELQRRFK